WDRPARAAGTGPGGAGCGWGDPHGRGGGRSRRVLTARGARRFQAAPRPWTTGESLRERAPETLWGSFLLSRWALLDRAERKETLNRADGWTVPPTVFI